jgi:hypothetical protein
MITGVAVNNVTFSGAAITWSTDRVCTSQVEYGETVSYGNLSSLDPTDTTVHNVILVALIANALYHFRVKSQDAAGNQAVSVDFSFATAPAPNTSSATYYVDPLNGSDTGAGLSPGTAWKSISKVNSATLRPGDHILFKRGGVWREQLIVPSSGSSGAAITFGAFGSGPAPQILGSQAENSAADWTNESNSIWYAHASLAPNIIWRNSVRLTMVSSKSALV